MPLDLSEREHTEAGATPSGLVDRVMAEIGAYVRDNGLSPGAALPSEAELAATAGVSRTVIREALRGLAALRLIDVGNGRRARVAPVDDSVISLLIDHAVHTHQVTIQQILDVRRTIELRTVALAAIRRTNAEAAEIVRLAAEMKASFAEPTKVMELDIEFHEAMASMSRNPLFGLLVGAFRVVTRQTWGLGWASRPNDAERMESVVGHMAIAKAIHSGDPAAAEKAVADHFDLTVKALIRAGVI